MPPHHLAKNMRDERIALAPEFHSPAVARCCEAWSRAFKAHKEGGTNPVSIYIRSNEAYREAMPPLSSPQNICDFVACVAHGVLVRAILFEQAASLLSAAGVASRAFKLLASTATAVAPGGSQKKNKIPGCETVGWNLPL